VIAFNNPLHIVLCAFVSHWKWKPLRTAFASNRNSSFVIRHFFWVSGGIKSPHPAAVLAIPAAMRITGSAPFPLLQRKPARSVTIPAFSGTLTVRAFSIRLRHFTPPLSAGNSNSGSENSKMNFGSPAVFAGLASGIGRILPLRAGTPSGISCCPQLSRLNPHSRKKWFPCVVWRL
jgi:hypothetical protein